MLTELLLLAGLAHAGSTVAFGPLLVKDNPAKTLGTVTDEYRAAARPPLEAVITAADATSADLVLTGTIVEVQTRSAGAPRFEVSVEWTLTARATGAAVYKVTTRALAVAKVSEAEAVEAALRVAAEQLVARAKFREALDKGVPAGALPVGNWAAPLRVKACQRSDLALPKQIGDLTPAVVVVSAGDAVGTGAVVSPDGFVVTAAHVVGDSPSPTVRFRAGLELPADVIRVDEGQDVAVLRVPGGGYTCLPMEPVTPGLGSDLFVVGSPAGLDYSVSKGIVSGVRTLDGWTFLQTDAAINPGNSGGPLLDGRGRMVGVTSWKVAARGFEGLGFGVPIPAVLTRLGVTYGDASDTDFSALRGKIKRDDSTPASVVDTPDPRRIYEILPSERQTQRVQGRRIGGIVLAGLGTAAVVGTGLWAASATPGTTDTGWSTMTAANTAGWASIAGGGVLFGLSFMPAPPATAVPGVVTLGGQF